VFGDDRLKVVISRCAREACSGVDQNLEERGNGMNDGWEKARGKSKNSEDVEKWRVESEKGRERASHPVSRSLSVMSDKSVSRPHMVRVTSDAGR
jgi:hypothetical protein